MLISNFLIAIPQVRIRGSKQVIQRMFLSNDRRWILTLLLNSTSQMRI
ncbi:hypothetical protein Leryth_026300 [Lithospermum erythrorhizon]|nr:hypothetical protein Leryth_026300 [Lithospermum erythrorhizon]